MRVGDKRRLTIPPSMGYMLFLCFITWTPRTCLFWFQSYRIHFLHSYGTQGAGKKIPPNSWLVFDVELIDVNWSKICSSRMSWYASFLKLLVHEFVGAFFHVSNFEIVLSFYRMKHLKDNICICRRGINLFIYFVFPVVTDKW